MVVTKNKILPLKNDKYQIECPGVTLIGSNKPNALSTLQTTAMIKQAIPSQ
jgi:hypothetical protein